MRAIDLDLVNNFDETIDRILLELQHETKPRLIKLAKKIMSLEEIRKSEGIDDIYFSKVEVAKELKCSLSTLERDINTLTMEGAISKRLGTHHNGERAIGNSLFIKVENLQDTIFLKKKKELLRELLNPYVNTTMV